MHTSDTSLSHVASEAFNETNWQEGNLHQFQIPNESMVFCLEQQCRAQAQALSTSISFLPDSGDIGLLTSSIGNVAPARFGSRGPPRAAAMNAMQPVRS